MQNYIFRLIKNEQFVGYMKYMSATLSFFSKDMYGWSASKIEYDDKDLWVGLKDKNQRLLFENDIFKHRHYLDSFFIIDQSDFGEETTVFQILDSKLEMPSIDVFKEPAHYLTFHAYLKDNPELENLLIEYKK